MPYFTQGYALVVGIANYPHVQPLPSTVLNDAGAVAQLLVDPRRAGYPPSQVKSLLDRQAAKSGILDGLRWLARRTSPEDTAVFFFSGHGGRLGDGPGAVNYLISHDTRVDALGPTAISGVELTDALRAVPAGRLVVLLDACHSGGTGDVKLLLAEQVPGVKGNPDDRLYDALAQGAGRVVLASSKSTEVSYVMPGAQNSVFTECLLEALSGRARHRGDGTLRMFDVVEYVWEEVPKRAGGRQHPIFKAQDMDANFPLALLMGGDKSLAPTPANAPLTTAVDRVKLRDLLVDRKNLEDLEVLFYDVEQEMRSDGVELAVNMEVTGGSGKAVRVQRLIDYLDRRGKIAYLVRRVRKEYPGEL